METTKKPLDAATSNGEDQAKLTPSKDSVAHKAKKVNTLREIRVRNDLSADVIVGIVQAMYPKYDNTLQSKCEHSDEYGVTLMPKAMAALIERFGSIPKTKIENRTLKNRVYCRLSDEDYEKLVRQSKADGFTTMQGCLTTLIRNYIDQ